MSVVRFYPQMQRTEFLELLRDKLHQAGFTTIPGSKLFRLGNLRVGTSDDKLCWAHIEDGNRVWTLYVSEKECSLTHDILIYGSPMIIYRTSDIGGVVSEQACTRFFAELDRLIGSDATKK